MLKILLIDREISGSVDFVEGCSIFRMHVENKLAQSLLEFCFASTSAPPNKAKFACKLC